MSYIKEIELPPLESFRHRIDLQLRFNDIDILGHLNNTVYFSLYDTGKAYYLEAVNGGRMNFRRVESVIANVNCQFVEPIFFGEPIEICTKCEHTGEKSIHLFQALVNKGTGAVKSYCRTVMVSIDPDSKQPVTLPDRWRQGIADYESGKINPEATLLKETI